MLLLCCLAGLLLAPASAEGVISGECYLRNGTQCDGLVNETKIDPNISERLLAQNCSSPIRKMKLTIKSVKRNTCVEMKYNITCSSVVEKLQSVVKHEACALGRQNIIHGNISWKAYGTLEAGAMEQDFGVTFVPHTAGMSWAMGTANSSGSPVAVLDQKKHLSSAYDHFIIPENNTVVFVSAADENGTISKTSFSITLSSKERPLSHVLSDIRIVKIERICMFLNTSEKYKWDDSPCTTTPLSNLQTRCTCEHNSAFAVVFAVHSVDVGPILNTSSIALEIASIVMLLLAAILLGVYRERMRNFDRVLVQINLSIALMLMHVFFVIGPLVTEIDIFCKIVAVGAHYFLVATAVLMSMEGTLMLMKILVPNRFNNGAATKRRRIIGVLIAWGLPAIYVAICSVVGFTSGKDNYVRFFYELGYADNCWINPDYAAVVIAPVALALAINVAIAIRLGVLVWKMSKSAEDFKPSHIRDVNKASHAGKALRAVVILMPILGIPWIVGFFVNAPKPYTSIFVTIHVIVNSLQGVLLFLHYIVFNAEMRSSIKRSWKSTVTSVSAITLSVQFVSSSESTHKNTKTRTESSAGLQDD